MNQVMKALEYVRDGMFVPYDLTKTIIGKMKVKKNKSILVVHSYEMLPVLHDLGYKDVTLVIDKVKPVVYHVAKYYGYKVANLKETKSMKFDIAVGNPPYGKNSNLAIRFLNETSKMTDKIVFVLPRTLRKPSAMNRVNDNLHIVHDETVADDTFKGGIMTCYQVWERNDSATRTKIDVISTHSDLIFVSPEEANVIVGRVGAGPCGKVFTDGFDTRSPSSHYFIKARNKSVIRRLKDLSETFQEAGRSTVGCPSLSKNQLIRIYMDN